MEVTGSDAYPVCSDITLKPVSTSFFVPPPDAHKMYACVLAAQECLWHCYVYLMYQKHCFYFDS